LDKIARVKNFKFTMIEATADDDIVLANELRQSAFSHSPEKVS